jgi:hypothetical protein
MNKTSSVISSSVSSDESTKSGFLGNLLSWKIIYKLCNQLPYQIVWEILKLYNMFAIITLNLDPDYSWGPYTKQVLKIVYYPFRGYYISQGESYTTMIILQSVIFGLLFLTFLVLYFVLKDEHSKGKTLIFLQVMFITQVIPIPIASTLFDPWKCNYSTGIKFPDQYCFGVLQMLYFSCCHFFHFLLWFLRLLLDIICKF